MYPSSTRTAYELALAADPYVEKIADRCCGIADMLRAGAVALALREFERESESIGRFLTYLILAAHLVEPVAPRLRRQLEANVSAVLGIVGRLERSLQDGELQGVGHVIEHHLARRLLEYRRYADEIARAFTPLRASA